MYYFNTLCIERYILIEYGLPYVGLSQLYLRPYKLTRALARVSLYGQSYESNYIIFTPVLETVLANEGFSPS